MSKTSAAVGLTLSPSRAAACKTVQRGSISAEFACAVRQQALGDRRRHHVLLMEGDAAVRDATRMLLKTDGYRVTAVASLAEGLRHAQGGARVDLLVTDHHLDGVSVAQAITALRGVLGQSLKAVVMSDDIGSVEQFSRDPLIRLVKKPSEADELLGQMKSLLTPE